MQFYRLIRQVWQCENVERQRAQIPKRQRTRWKEQGILQELNLSLQSFIYDKRSSGNGKDSADEVKRYNRFTAVT